MKICIYGAGAVGAFVAGQLIRGDSEGALDVSLVARGPHLAAMQANGLTMQCDGESVNLPVRCTEDPAELGIQDVVIVALKAHQAPGEAEKIADHLLGSETIVVPAMNGVPWWYFHDLDCPGKPELRGQPLHGVDPGARQWNAIGPERVIGCVVYVSAEIIAPGVVDYGRGGGLFIGEPDCSDSPRLNRLFESLSATGEKNSGLRITKRDDIRRDVWTKLWSNVSINPTTALTLMPVNRIASDEGGAKVLKAMMLEAQEVAVALGVNFTSKPDDVINRVRENPGRKSSMHQDVEKGRVLEIDAIVKAVAELGDLVGVETPTIDIIYTLVRLRAEASGLVPDKL